MRVILAAKLEEAFMNMGEKKNKFRSVVFLFLLAVSAQCGKDDTDDAIPYTPFDPIVININLPQYFALQSDGASLAMSQGGVRGIIVYRKNSTDYRAFERNCSYQPNSACATVDIHSTTLYMFDACCNSSFNFDGDPQGGPAWRPLRQYRVDQIGSQITITDEVIN
jgi:hypothetical protein